jgi:hypothetical protein
VREAPVAPEPCEPKELAEFEVIFRLVTVAVVDDGLLMLK